MRESDALQEYIDGTWRRFVQGVLAAFFCGLGAGVLLATGVLICLRLH